MADPRKALFISGRPMGFVSIDGTSIPVIPAQDFLLGLQHVTNLVGGQQGILPESIASGSAYGIVYVGPGGGLTSLAPLTSGQVIIGSTGNAPVAGAISGTTNRVTVTLGSGTITLTTPQDTHSGATPTFANMTISGRAANTFLAGPVAASGNAVFRALNPADLTPICGTYTPTLTNTTNVAASTAYEAFYRDFGSQVEVFVKVDIDPAAAGQVVLGVSLPIASNMTTDQHLIGSGAAIAVAGLSVGIHADTTNDRAVVEFIAVDTANRSFYLHFSYRKL